MKKENFRAEALRKLRDPEELDTLFDLVRPAHWYVLVAVALAGVALVAWGFGGVVSTVVSGSGILLREGGVVDIPSLGSGRIIRVLVAPDERVEAGQVLAVLEQPELLRRIEESQRRLALLRNYRREQETVPSGDRRGQVETDLLVVKEEADLEVLQERLTQESTIQSSTDGRVVELFRRAGQMIREGEALLALEDAAEDSLPLRVQAFVPAGQGKNVRVGLEAFVSPSVVRREEFGMLRGTVSHISRFPTSLQGMLALLGNPEVARAMAGEGAHLAITIDLQQAPTASGYRWTSREGPPFPLQSGTFCRVAVTIRNQPPITLVLPGLEGLFTSGAESSSGGL